MKQPAILQCAIGFTGGVLAGSFFALPLAFGAVGLAAAVLALKTRRFPGLMLASAALGVWRIAASPLVPPPDDIAALAGKSIKAEGTVVSFPVNKGDTQKVVVELSADGRRGQTLVSLSPYPSLRPGDQVRVSGRLQQPAQFDGFDYRAYLARDGIHSVLYRAKLDVTGRNPSLTSRLYDVRQTFQRRLQELFPEPSAGFLLGILFGERAGMPEELQTAFQRTGTTHVLALSGYNISILIAVIVRLLGRRPAVLWLSFVFIAAFVLMVGPDAPVLRAALMGSFLLLGQMFGRPQVAALACLVTGAAMLAWNPWSLRYDLGFDLSFMATLGILRFEPAVRERLTKLPALLREPLSATVAASLPTAPLIALSFGTVSLISPVANVVIVPLIPYLMLAGFMISSLGLLSPVAATPPAAIAGWFVDRLLGTIGWLSELPLASVQLEHAKPLLAGITLAVCVVAMFRLRRHPGDPVTATKSSTREAYA